MALHADQLDPTNFSGRDERPCAKCDLTAAPAVTLWPGLYVLNEYGQLNPCTEQGLEQPATGDWLMRQCTGCGYAWPERTADNPRE